MIIRKKYIYYRDVHRRYNDDSDDYLAGEYLHTPVLSFPSNTAFSAVAVVGSVARRRRRILFWFCGSHCTGFSLNLARRK